MDYVSSPSWDLIYPPIPLSSLQIHENLGKVEEGEEGMGLFEVKLSSFVMILVRPISQEGNASLLGKLRALQLDLQNPSSVGKGQGSLVKDPISEAVNVNAGANKKTGKYISLSKSGIPPNSPTSRLPPKKKLSAPSNPLNRQIHPDMIIPSKVPPPSFLFKEGVTPYLNKVSQETGKWEWEKLPKCTLKIARSDGGSIGKSLILLEAEGTARRLLGAVIAPSILLTPVSQNRVKVRLHNFEGKYHEYIFSFPASETSKMEVFMECVREEARRELRERRMDPSFMKLLQSSLTAEQGMILTGTKELSKHSKVQLQTTCTSDGTEVVNGLGGAESFLFNTKSSNGEDQVWLQVTSSLCPGLTLVNLNLIYSNWSLTKSSNMVQLKITNEKVEWTYDMEVSEVDEYLRAVPTALELKEERLRKMEREEDAKRAQIQELNVIEMKIRESSDSWMKRVEVPQHQIMLSASPPPTPSPLNGPSLQILKEKESKLSNRSDSATTAVDREIIQFDKKEKSTELYRVKSTRQDMEINNLTNFLKDRVKDNKKLYETFIGFHEQNLQLQRKSNKRK